MEGPEVPTEHLLEHMHHEAHHAGEENRWIMGVALSSAIIAGMAAVAALTAGMDANLAMIHQMQASDQWNYYQAKGVKASVLSTKIELLAAVGKTPDPKDKAKLAEYKKEQEEIKAEADEKQKSSQEHLENHEVMARAVTIFQVAIALGAVAALAKRRTYWFISLGATMVGVYFLWGALSTHFHMAAIERRAEEARAAAEHAPPAGGHEKPAHEPAAHEPAAPEPAAH